MEPNHTHFIFFDDGQEKVYGGEIAFLAEFQRVIAEQHAEPQNAHSVASLSRGESIIAGYSSSFDYLNLSILR